MTLLPGFDAFGQRVNPMLQRFGRGPEGVKCKTCAHLDRYHGSSRTYLKCGLRHDNTNGAATDHRAGYSAVRNTRRRPHER